MEGFGLANKTEDPSSRNYMNYPDVLAVLMAADTCEGLAHSEKPGTGETGQVRARAKYLAGAVLAAHGAAVPDGGNSVSGGDGEQHSGDGRGNGKKKDSPGGGTGPGGTEQPPETPTDERLKLFAAENGLGFVVPTGYKRKLEEFTEYKWPGRVDNSEEIHQTLDKDKRRVLYICQELMIRRNRYDNNISHIRRPSRRAKQMRHFLEEVNKVLGNIHGLAYAKLVRKEIRALKRLLLKTITESVNDEKLEAKIFEISFVFLGYYRYAVELKRDNYRSRTFTAGSFAEVIGEKNVYDAFHHRWGEMKAVGDFGSGCGENMMQIADGVAKATLEKSEEEIDAQKDEFRRRYMEEVMEDYIRNRTKYPDPPWEHIDTLIQDKVRAALEKERSENDTAGILSSSFREKFICIDQTEYAFLRPGIKKLRGIRADICAPRDEFRRQSGLGDGSLDIALTSLTLDRAKSKQNLAANIAASLKEGGKAVFALNPEFTTKNDGQPGWEMPIDYGTEGDWDLSSEDEIGYLQKLLPLLKGVGLKPVRIGRHECRVISNDCVTDPNDPDYGPQKYNLLVVACVKDTGVSAFTGDKPDDNGPPV